MRYLLIGLAALGLMASAACGDGDSSDGAPTIAPSKATAAATAAKEAGTPIVLRNPTTTASGLKYVDDKAGSGASAETAKEVTVHYTGRLASNGKKFDSSVDRGTPATFAINGVIPGFAEAIKTMKVGGKRTALLPAALAYGASPPPNSGIPANAELVFEIELIAVK